MVLVFSDHANDSRHLRREVAHAFKHELTIIPFRIDASLPKGSLEYFLDAVHWLDALSQPLEQHLEALTVRLKALMSLGEASPFTHRFHAEESAPTDAAGSFAVSENLRREGEHEAKEALEAQVREREEKERLELERRQQVHCAAEWMAEARHYLDTDDYAHALPLLQKAADEGNKEAMQPLGFLYYKGRGVTQDYDKAREWFQKAADAGDGNAMVLMGGMYYYGQGVIRDYAEARRWLEKAADAGDASAMGLLGRLY